MTDDRDLAESALAPSNAKCQQCGQPTDSMSMDESGEPICKACFARQYGPCVWQENEDGYYDTTCGNAFVMESGTPRENGMRWCCYCGRRMHDVAYTSDVGDA